MEDRKKLTGEELIQLIQDNMQPDDFAYEHYDYCDFDLNDKENILLFGASEYVDGKDNSDECYVVKYFKEHDVYILLEGWYSSQDGAVYEEDNYSVVKPKEVIRIEWE